MSQYKTVLNLSASVIFLFLCLSMTGCATLAVDHYIQHPSSNFFDVFTPTDKEWLGVYSGLELIDNHIYAHIIAIPSSDDCQERPCINLLLPTEKNYDAKVTLRLGGTINKQLSAGDKCAGQSVRIIFFQSLNENEMEEGVKKDVELIQPNSNWTGYPSVVIVRFKNHYPGALTYKTGPESVDFLVRKFDCAENCSTLWQCKNKENNIAGVILKPFAFLFDVVTFPIQIFLFSWSYTR